MKTAAIADFKARLSEYLGHLADGPLVVTRHGRPAAVILSAPEDPDELDRLLIAHDPKFHQVVERSRRSELIAHDEFWARAEKRTAPAISRPKRGRKRGS